MNPGTANREGSGLADELRRADWLILTSEWDDWNEPNDSTEYGPSEPNEVVRDDFCLRLERGAVPAVRALRPGGVKTALVTGSSGLIGSEMVATLDRLGLGACTGVDNNMRRDFFGPDGDTTANLERLVRRDEAVRAPRRSTSAIGTGSRRLVGDVRPDLVVHCAAQPSHDLAARRPFDDFDVNAVGHAQPARGGAGVAARSRRSSSSRRTRCTATRRTSSSSSSSRRGTTTRIRRSARGSTRAAGSTPRCTASSARRRRPPTSSSRSTAATSACRRCASAVAASRARTTRAPSCTASSPTSRDACARGARIGSTATRESRSGTTSTPRTSARRRSPSPDAPRPGAVYNIGGGRENSVSILEAIARLEELTGAKLDVEYVDEARRGDHICYISDLRRLQGRLPRAGTSRSRSTRSSAISCGRRDEACARDRRGRVHRLASDRSAARRRTSTSRCSTTSRPASRENVPSEPRRSSRGTSATGRSSTRSSRASASTRCSTSPGRRASGSRSPSPRSICGRTSSGP